MGVEVFDAAQNRAMPCLSYKYAGENYTLDLVAGRCAYHQLAVRHSLPPSRIKLIRRGILLPPSGHVDLADALEQPGTVLMSGTPQEEQLPGTAARVAGEARGALRLAYAAVVRRSLRRDLVDVMGWLWATAISAVALAWAFVSSALVAPAPRQGRPGRPLDPRDE